MSKIIIWRNSALIALLPLFLLVRWSMTANSPFYYRLDYLVGHDYGDGDNFAMLAMVVFLLDAVLAVVLAIRGVRRRSS